VSEHRGMNPVSRKVNTSMHEYSRNGSTSTPQRGGTVTRAQTNTLLDAALSYADRGWHVFPCHTPTADGCSCRQDACEDIGKHPRTKHGFKDATTDEAQIRRWWKMWPAANVAIRTGAVSALAVLDRDDYKNGSDTLEELERTYSPLPETVLGLTGGGGQHYLFAHPGNHVPTDVDTLGAGLDTRGDGGYIIAPPSLHKSGKRYAWEVLHEPQDMPLAPLPDWVQALCQKTARQAGPSAGEPIPDHQRNVRLFRLGASMRAKGFQEAAIFAALWETNLTQCQPPLTEAEVRKIAHSDCRYEARPSTQDPQQRRSGETPGPEQESPLPYSDYTNALAFVRDHGHNLRYCYPWNAWLVWTGTHWQRDTSGEVMRLAKQTVKRLARQIESLEETPAKALMAHIKASLSTAKLKAMIENAQSEPGIAVQPDQLDADPWLLNCTNGTLDLRTGALRPHLQEDMLTRCLPIAYDPEARCPGWIAFLENAMGGDAALIVFLQRALGYSLTGSTREQCFFLLHGPTKTGKSTFVNMAKAVLGPYATQAETSTFLHKDRETVRNDLADLAGMRLVSAIETDEGKRLAEALIKQLTGGTDTVKARFSFEEYFEYRPQFKVFLATNHLPKITAQDDAIWERVHRVPFLVQIPKEARDKQLEDKLRSELPGILAWMVRGCLAWQRDDDLLVPAAVTQSTQQYRDEMDDVGRFLTEVCLLGQDYYKTQASTLLKTYHQWCGQTTMTGKAFAKQLTDKGYTTKHTMTGNYWQGIGLPSELMPEQDKKAREGA
jgi:putative DNA primase/helicase